MEIIITAQEETDVLFCIFKNVKRYQISIF